MNGKKFAVNRIAKKKKIDAIEINVSFESKYDWDLQLVYPEPFPGEVFHKSFIENFPVKPIVYTNLVRPKPKDLSFIKGLPVYLIQGDDCPDDLFAAWVCHAVDCEPRSLEVKEKCGEFIYFLPSDEGIEKWYTETTAQSI